MQSIFHYMSVYMVLTTFTLFLLAFNQLMCFESSHDVALFIGVSYAGFALVQLVIAATAPIKNGIFKLFQRVFWVLIALFTFLGA